MRVLTKEDPELAGHLDQLTHHEAAQYPLWGPENLKYYRSYFAFARSVDRSFAVSEQGRALLAVRLSCCVDNQGVKSLSFEGLPAPCLEGEDCDSVWRRSAVRLAKKHLDGIFESDAIQVATHRDFLLGGRISFLTHYLLDLGGRATPEFVRLIDLSPPAEELHSQLTKSYRNQVRWGERNLAIEVIGPGAVAQGLIDTFAELHAEAAGGVTRSRESWRAQQSMVEAGEAFIITGHLQGELVTAALFTFSDAQCLYGVSASRRDLFHMPLSHALLWRAILHARELGCRSFEMGEVVYPGHNEVSAKEIGISRFKRGFGGRVHQRLLVRWSTDA